MVFSPQQPFPILTPTSIALPITSNGSGEKKKAPNLLSADHTSPISAPSASYAN